MTKRRDILDFFDDIVGAMEDIRTARPLVIEARQRERAAAGERV
jgi:hypothetical protein